MGSNNTKSKRLLLHKNILRVSFNIDLTTSSFLIISKNLQSWQRYWLLFQHIIVLHFSLFQKKKPVSEVSKFGNFRIPQLKTKTILTEIKMIHSFCTTGKSLSKCQLKWKLSKYELWKFSVNYTKHIAKEIRQQRTNLENLLKILKKVLMRMITQISIMESRMN